jgi:outer membrane biosynthesis protein TonB
MSAVQSARFTLRPDYGLLLLALAFSAVVNVLLFVAVVYLFPRLVAYSKLHTLTEMHRFQPARTNMPALREPPLLFVQVNPDQVSAEAPKNAKYYSSQNSVAANPDPVKDTETPKIDGTQIHVAKTEDVPRSKAVPLQPSVPKEPIPEPKPVEPDPQPAQPEPKAAQKPGDLAIMKPEDAKEEKPALETPHVRPRTIAQALQQNGIVGQKMKQDGGVRRGQVIPSFDALGSAFGEYDARVIAAISQHWYDLIEGQHISRDRAGRVVVEFRLNYDGRVSDMEVVESDVGLPLALLCRRAISDPGPYEKWPAKMRQTVGADYRDVKFTFWYE